MPSRGEIAILMNSSNGDNHGYTFHADWLNGELNDSWDPFDHADVQASLPASSRAPMISAKTP